MVLALAVLLLLAGTLLATAARPPQRVSATVAGAGSAPLLVVDTSWLGDLDGAVEVSASGPGPVLVAVGTSGDVASWVAGAATTTATGPAVDGVLAVSTSEGEAQVPDPAGSDLWTAQSRGTGSAELTTDLTTSGGGGRSSVLVASDGASAAPTEVRLTWTERPVPLAAAVLLGTGGLLALLLVAGRRRRTGGVVTLPETPVAAGPLPRVVEHPTDDGAPRARVEAVPVLPSSVEDARGTPEEPVLLRRPRGRDRRSPR